MNDAAPRADSGRLAESLLHFARALRRAGLPVGPGALVDALEALQCAGLGARADVRASLRAVFVKRPEHMVLFDQLFAAFWRRRGFVESFMAELSPARAAPKPPPPAAPGALRVQEALAPPAKPAAAVTAEREARLLSSDEEALRRKDFAQMTAAEIAAAERLVARLRFASDRMMARRWRPNPRGRAFDARATLRRSLRSGGEAIALVRRSRQTRPAKIVALCDISGSMADYTRVFLLFLHRLCECRKDTQIFLFGTRLTNVTRAIRARDVDEALARVGRQAKDWSGGTRIAASLHRFNRDWSRRVLGGRAIVLLFTDGLERAPGEDLGAEMRRLRASCRRLVWLNPLLRFEGFEARAQGVRAMLPHVDEFRPIHDLASLEALCRALEEPAPLRTPARISAASDVAEKR